MRPARSMLVGLILAGIAVGGCAVWQASQPSPAPPPSQASQPASAPATHAGDAYRPYIYGGLPKTSQPLTLLKNKGYMAGYSEKHRDPAWVAYRLFQVDDPQTHPRLSRFLTDDRTEAKVAHGDYTSSGYDRGHMAPNYAIDVCYGEDGQRQTFLMSNICPQKPKLNRQVWEQLESTEIRDYAVRFEEIWVIDGPIFDDQPEKLPAGVDIPRAFYKIIVDEVSGKPRMLAFIMPQGVKGNEPLKGFLVSVEKVEKATGLDFFTELGKEAEEQLEKVAAKEMW